MNDSPFLVSLLKNETKSRRALHSLLPVEICEYVAPCAEGDIAQYANVLLDYFDAGFRPFAGVLEVVTNRGGGRADGGCCSAPEDSVRFVHGTDPRGIATVVRCNPPSCGVRDLSLGRRLTVCRLMRSASSEKKDECKQEHSHFQLQYEYD